MAQRWLFKTEPSAYSFAQLEADRRTVWDGVKNALALRHLSAVAKGDEVLFYHTGDEKAVVGTATVTRGAYPDPKQKDAKLLVGIRLGPRGSAQRQAEEAPNSGADSMIGHTSGVRSSPTWRRARW